MSLICKIITQVSEASHVSQYQGSVSQQAQIWNIQLFILNSLLMK